MLCPSCGTEHSPKQCPQPLAANADAFATLDFEPDPLDLEDSEMADSPLEARPASRLIEFPGVTRRAMPQWRKELSERVREVQERKAREAAVELSVATEEAFALGVEVPPATPPQLELLPQTEAPEINPVLAAALRRIERAHQVAASNSSGYSRTATAVAIARDHETEVEFTAEVAPAIGVMSDVEPEINTERSHNLVVVQAPIISQSEVAPELESEPPPPDLEPLLEVQAEPIEKPRPKRLIGDDLNDPALSYLDSIGLAGGPVQVEDRARLSTRFVAAVLDVITVGFLSLPFAALIELQDGNWHQPRIIALMSGIVALLMFFYATVSTALTGRTLGMRLLSLRAVDARNGLIPTGNQSAGRAFVYLLSLATLGIGLLMAFARGEGKTAHDRLTRTAVVRD
ncbi:MAG: hypothetical protein JWM21_3490 [Acidobacteria bacterium]|nr:hypothetical protein [Acidobacteriota bacterium]